MKIEELEARLKVLEDKNRNLQDIEEIKKLQRIYGYYIERAQLDEVADLFSDSPDVSLGPDKTVMVGKENIRRMFSSQRPMGVPQGGTKPDDYLHITMPVTGVVDVDTDGKTAKGRWYALTYLCNATPLGGAVFGVGVYENDYIKEDGKWKIWHLRFEDIFLSPYEDGWAKTPKLWEKLRRIKNIAEQLGYVPDLPPPVTGKSPFGEQVPFHYKHPITGK